MGGRKSIRPFSIQIVPASTMRYHAYLQWVRMASRNFSRTALKKDTKQREPMSIEDPDEP